MKWLIAFCAIVLSAQAENYCKLDVDASCRQRYSGVSNELLAKCNATYSGFPSHVDHLQAYANEQIIRSFDHLLLAVNFGTYVHNRPGFEKTFRGLSDTAWNRGIDLIKHITKRGGEHNFNSRSSRTSDKSTALELSEIEALGLALDIEKDLAVKAHNIHEMYSHANHKAHYDAEISHYIEEEFIEEQAGTVRKLAGHINDLKNFFNGVADRSLALFMFDEYLQKQ